MEDIQCIFCNRDSDQIVIEENGYKGRKCPQCGLIFISPRPTLAETLSLYRDDQAHISAESHISQAPSKRLYARHNLRIIKNFKRNGSMLEIGAGAGYFLDEARKEGFGVYGIELNKPQADFIRNKLGIACEQYPLDVSLFDGKKFDIIYHCDLISHLYDPISEFQQINDRLEKDGILVFETGNLGDVREEYYRLIPTFQYPDHLFLFSENNLKELLALTGFELIKIYRYSIVLELVLLRMSRKVIDFTKPARRTKNMGRPTGLPSSGISNNAISGLSLRQLIWNAGSYFIYLVRYKIGRVMPKIGRPQTIVVVARKVIDSRVAGMLPDRGKW